MNVFSNWKIREKINENWIEKAIAIRIFSENFLFAFEMLYQSSHKKTLPKNNPHRDENKNIVDVDKVYEKLVDDWLQGGGEWQIVRP